MPTYQALALSQVVYEEEQSYDRAWNLRALTVICLPNHPKSPKALQLVWR